MTTHVSTRQYYATSTANESTKTFNSVLIDNDNGAVTDRGLFIVVLGHSNNGTRFPTSLTLDGVSGTLLGNQGADGGAACLSGVFYFDDAAMPDSGSYTVVSTQAGDGTRFSIFVMERTFVDQTTPAATLTWDALLNTSDGNTITNTLTGAAGETAITFLGAVDGTATSTGSHIIPSGTISRENIEGTTFTVSGTIAEDANVATASEDYLWTLDSNVVDGLLDSVLAASFVINSSAVASAGIVKQFQNQNMGTHGFNGAIIC